MTMAHSSVKMQSTKRAVVQRVFFLMIIRSAMSESHNISFNFTSSQSNYPSIIFQGNANTLNSAIELSIVPATESGVEIVGRALYHQAMHLWDSSTGNVADFTSRFTFAINSKNATEFADGVAFFLAPNGSQIPEGSKGGSLGLTNSTNSSAAFVAVEFDTFVNKQLDPGCLHVGIDVNSLVSVRNVCVPWARYSILNGKLLHAQVTLNSTEKNLSVVFGDSDNNSTSLHYHLANLTENLPEWVNFGFSAATGTYFESHTIYSWEFSSTLRVPDTPTGGTSQSKKSKSWVWAITGVGTFILVLFVAGFGWYFYTPGRERNGPNGEEDDNQSIDEGFEQSKGPKKYSYRVLTMATNNFASAQLLGEGGFGRVYEGQLADVNVPVAIKKITPESKQGLKEYATEVKTIRLLRHKNLVELIGWCHERNEFLLVYEFMSNGSLDSHLFKGKAPLTWEKRYNIAKGIALGLKYLHEDLKQCVVHRDVKSSNVLLDSEFTAKLGDFGLARTVDHAKGSQTTLLAGTIGYLAPECIYTGKASKESDVYSFGVVLLEIACGRKVIESRAAEDQVRLVMWVWELYGVGKLMDAVDPKLGKDFDVRQMECLMITGLWCVHPDPTERPPISRVISFLNFDASPPVLPSKLPVPTYVAPPSIQLELLHTLSSSKSCGSSSALLSYDE